MICGASISIDLAAEAIKIERGADGEPLRLTFPLNGAPVKHPLPYCRTRPTDPAVAKLRDAELAAFKKLIVPGSDDMTTSATRDGSAVVIRSSNTSPRQIDGPPPALAIEQTQTLSLSSLGHLVVDTDRTSTDSAGKVTKTKSRLVYVRTKGFD